MTAIALLNADAAPHLIADTLLSADGLDPHPEAGVYLPPLGSIPSQQGTDQKPWYIARLGRKTIILPGCSGILAFAGEAQHAFKFWDALSAKIRTRLAYGQGRVDRATVEAALALVDSRRFAILGILIRADGGFEPFIHGAVVEVVTKHHGRCHVAGSGVALVRRAITKHDDWLGRFDVPPKGATTDLAEKISALMLYEESDPDYGKPGGAVDSGCGGFYEWYQIKPEGVARMPTRLDLHVRRGDGGLEFTRVYFVEMLQQPVQPGETPTSQRYAINHLTLGIDPQIPREDDLKWWNLAPPVVQGVLIPLTFVLYEQGSSTCRLQGPATDETLSAMFGNRLDVDRVQVICSGTSDASSRGLIAGPGETLAQIEFMAGKLSVRLAPTVVDAILATFQRLP